MKLLNTHSLSFDHVQRYLLVLILMATTYTYTNNALMYLSPEFNNVEKICRELWSDLDTLIFNQSLEKEWIENSDYLFNQFLLLNQSVSNLIVGQKQSSYLLEDIYYLQFIINNLEERYVLMSKSIQNSSTQQMYIFLQQTKQELESLIAMNQEVILI